MKLHKRIICAFSILTLSIFLLLILNVPANDTVAVEDNYIEASQLHGAKVEDEISFIYTQERSVDLGSNADIYVGLTDKYKSQNSYLVYIFENYDEIVAEPVEKSEDIVHFSIPFTDITQVGDYYFDRLVVGDSIYTEQKIAKNENFGSSFHVNVGEDYTNLGLPADVYSLNEDGTYDKEEDIEAAIKHKNNKMLITDEASKFKADKNDILIALDPGHGGYDPGACAYGYRESDITLQIAYACKRRLEEFQGVSVVMSRYDDTYVGLSERVTNLLYPRKPDLFVSLHINAGGGSGAEVWVQYPGCTWHSEYYDQGAIIGQDIVNHICERFGIGNRGIHWRLCTDGSQYPNSAQGDYFTVLYYSRYYEIPGFLMEHAFIDGAYNDLNILHSPENVRMLGNFDAESIAAYYGLKEKPSDLLSGTYVISTAMYRSQVLDVDHASTEDYATTFLWEYNCGKNQQWIIESDDNYYVRLKNVNSNKYLEVKDGQLFYSATICQNSWCDDNKQKFILRQGENGYKIKSAINSNYLFDLDHCSILNGTNIFMYVPTEGFNQYWELYNVDSDVKSSDSDFKDGFYKVLSRDHSYGDQVIDIEGCSVNKGANALSWASGTTSMNQVFYIKNEGKYHSITSVNSDLGIVDDHGFPFPGTHVFQYANEYPNENKYWSIQKQPDNSYKLYSSSSGQVLEIYGGVATNGARITTYIDHDGLAQKWDLQKVENPYEAINTLALTYKNTISDGNYVISSVINSNFCLDVYQASVDNLANVELYQKLNSSNQLWEIKNLDDGFVSIKSCNSNKYLDVFGASKGPGSNVTQCDWNGGLNQKWVIVPDRGSYKILSAQIINLNLAAASSNVSNLTNINVNQASFEATQNFYINVGYLKTPIMSNPTTWVNQMVNYWVRYSHAEYPSFYYDKDAPNITEFCNIAYQEANCEGVDPSVLFCQAMKETGWLQFKGDVKIEQFNFGGLGAVGGGAQGASFHNVREGLKAQVQHLKCYASTEDIMYPPIVDERWQAVIDKWGRGSAPCVEDLDGKWAYPGINYGEEIVAMMRIMYDC